MKKKILVFLYLISCLQAFSQSYPYKTLEEAFKAADYNPSSANTAHFVATADPHSGMGKEGFPKIIVDEINEMKSLPIFLLVNGDIILSASRCFGQIPGDKQKKLALKEFADFVKSTANLSKDVPLKMTLGNHDTYPYEKDGELFRQAFPDRKVYDSFIKNNICFFLLNGGQSGDIDKKQEDWLKEKVANLKPDMTLILFIHQPGLGNVVRERGIATTIRNVFKGHKGEMWLISGHNHNNRVSVYKLPETLITQAVTTTCNPKMWGSESPGYWIYCLKDGQVHARIFRKLGEGYRIDKKPDYKSAKPIPVAFENLKNKLWTLMVGDGDRQYLVKAKAMDVETWWAYVRELVYRLPLEKAKGAKKVAILASIKTDKKHNNQLFLSGDGETWIKQVLPKPEHGVYLFDIPNEIANGKSLFIKLEGANSIVGGFALTK